jgi:CheY-like chemotaxis protein
VHYKDFISTSKQLFVVLDLDGRIIQSSLGFKSLLPPAYLLSTDGLFDVFLSKSNITKFKTLLNLKDANLQVLYAKFQLSFSESMFIFAITKDDDKIFISLYPETPTEIKIDVQALPIQKIVIADDDNVSLLLMSGLLTKMGYKVLVAKNGKQAFSLIQENDVSIFFTDCEMPIMNGFAVSKLLRSMKFTLPIIGVTGSSDTHHLKNQAKQCGMDDYILKPISEAKLKDLIFKWIVQRPHYGQ